MVSQRTKDAGNRAFFVFFILGIILIGVGFYIMWWGGDDFNTATGMTVDLIGWIILFETMAADAISRGCGGKKGKGIRECQLRVISSSRNSRQF